MNSDEIKKNSNSYLSFKLENELFAAHVSKVLNILEMTKITKVPKSPEYLLGVINLRGTVLPVIDTRMKFGLKISNYTINTCIIVLEIEIDNETVIVGALVDAVQEVLEVEPQNIMPPPSIGSKYKSEFIEGIAKSGENFIMILNMDKVFSSEDLVMVKDTIEKNK